MNLNRLKQHWATIIVYIVLSILVLTTSLSSNVFLTKRNIDNILCSAVAVGLVSIGQTFAILTEGIDLSVGSVISLVTCLTAGMINGKESSIVPVVALVLGLALLIGFCNGAIIAWTGVSPLIVTLGMMSVIQGITLLYTKGPCGEIPASCGFLAWGKVASIPFPVFLLAAVSIFAIFILKRTTFGRYIYATGGNEEIARLSGIKTDWVKIFSYITCSFTAALAGLFLNSRMGMGDPIVGEGYMIDSVVPVLFGGTSFSGGSGGVVGTIAGVFILTILKNALNLFDVSTYWQWIIEGGIILIAVAFYWREKG